MTNIKTLVTLYTKYGIEGADIIGGNMLLLYPSDTEAEKGSSTQELVNEFFEKVNKIVQDNELKRSIKNVGGVEVAQLSKYSRDGRRGVSASYEQAISNLHPSEETRKRLEGRSEKIKLGVWANSALSRAQNK